MILLRISKVMKELFHVYSIGYQLVVIVCNHICVFNLKLIKLFPDENQACKRVEKKHKPRPFRFYCFGDVFVRPQHFGQN